MRKEALRDLIFSIFKSGKSYSATLQADVIVDFSDGQRLSCRQGEIEDYSSHHSQIAGFRVLLDGVPGYASTENLSEEGLRRCFGEAVENANMVLKFGGKPDWTSSLPSGEKGNFWIEGEDSPSVTGPSIEEKLKAAKALEKTALDFSINVKAVSPSAVSDSRTQRILLNSLGLQAQFQKTFYSAMLSVVASDNSVSKTSWKGQTHADFQAIQIKTLAELAASVSVAKLKSKELATGNYPTLIDRDVMVTLLSCFGSALSGKDIFEKTSFLGKYLEEDVASSIVEVVDSPIEIPGYWAPFDDEGCVRKPLSLVSAGKLKSFLTNWDFSRRLGHPMTSHASRNPSSDLGIEPTSMVLKSGKESRSQLLAKMGSGVWLQELNGFHSGYNGTTGDFSLPGEGYWVENGEIKYPIGPFVVSGNLVSLFKSIVGIGNEWHTRSSVHRAPDVLIEGLSYAGK